MDLAIVENLVCPQPHAAAPLVVRADTVEGARLVEGLAGCPECGMEWPVVNGALMFGAARVEPGELPYDGGTLAALLSLSEPDAVVIADGVNADDVARLAEEYGARIIAFDAPPAPSHAATINGATRAPIGGGVASAAVLARPKRSPDFIESVAAALRPGGRCVCIAAVPLPATLSEIARDSQARIGERVAVTSPITLGRRRG